MVNWEFVIEATRAKNYEKHIPKNSKNYPKIEEKFTHWNKKKSTPWQNGKGGVRDLLYVIQISIYTEYYTVHHSTYYYYLLVTYIHNNYDENYDYMHNYYALRD